MSLRRQHPAPVDQSLDIFRPFTDLMSNAFMILSFFLVLLLFQSLALNQKLKAAQPIIIDEKSGKFKFQSGSAEISPSFKKYLDQEVVPTIVSITQEQDIAFIQVIGHTDGQLNSQASNLDQKLESAAQNQTKISDLSAGSNADLGLILAIAVIQSLQRSGELNQVPFQAYSAAQLYLPSESIKLAPINRNADESRRRIEIRFVPPGQKK
jgi:outer membrane protein OmpA-like peptidoglycan-associated protein